MSKPTLQETLRRWWEGKFIPYENEPSGSVFFVGGNFERHWTASVARAVYEFLKHEWKWTIGTCLASAGLILTYVRFF